MAVSSVHFIPECDHDLIFGYIRINDINTIPNPIAHLILLYFYRLEEFNNTYKGKDIKIKGLNYKKCKSSSSFKDDLPDDNSQSIFGRIIAKSPYKYHWRLKWKNAKHSNVGFIDASEYKQYYNLDFEESLTTYSLSIVDDQTGQIDFYLDLQNGNCSYTVDGMENYDNYFSNIDIDKEFILAISIKQKYCEWEIISFETDEIFNTRIICEPCLDFYGIIGYCRSICDRKLKIIYYEKAMKINSNCSFVFKEYIECLIQEKELIKAYNIIMNKWDKYNINISKWIGYVAETIYNLGDKYEYAINLYNKIPDDILYNSVWCGQKAHCYQKLGQNKYALIEYDKFLYKTNLNHNNLMKSNIEDNIGNVYFVLKDYNNAIKHAIKAVQYYPTNSFALNNLGYYYWIVGKYSKAEQCYKKCLNNDRKHQLANGNLANLLFEQNKQNEAEMYMEIALTIKADMEHPDVAPKLLLNYAIVLYKKDKYIESLKICSELSKRDDFKLNENIHKCYYLYSQNYWNLKQIHDGLKYIQKAIELAPNNQDYLEMFNQYQMETAITQ